MRKKTKEDDFNRLTKFNEFNKYIKYMFIDEKHATIFQIDRRRMKFFFQSFNFYFVVDSIVVDSIVVKNNVKRIISYFRLSFLQLFACKNDRELEDLISKKHKFDDCRLFFVF